MESSETDPEIQKIDIKDEKFFNEADFEDLKAKNTPTSRMFVTTATLEPTPLNNKRI